MGVFGVCGVYVCLCGVSDCVLSSVVFVRVVFAWGLVCVVCVCGAFCVCCGVCGVCACDVCVDSAMSVSSGVRVVFVWGWCLFVGCGVCVRMLVCVCLWCVWWVCVRAVFVRVCGCLFV